MPSEQQRSLALSPSPSSAPMPAPVAMNDLQAVKADFSEKDDVFQDGFLQGTSPALEVKTAQERSTVSTSASLTIAQHCIFKIPA